MSEQIKIFNLPVSDISNENFEINIYDSFASDDGSDIVDYMRNRKLTSAWATTDSTDAANTIIEFVSGDSFQLTDFILIYHNFKNFDLEYWDGSLWQNLASVTNNTSDFYHFETTAIETTKVRIIVYNTMTADDDKIITRAIICEKMLTGQFQSWPVIQDPTQEMIRKDSTMLSGKHFISESVGSFSCKLKWKALNVQADFDIIERMFLFRKPFMIWLCGGDENQFKFYLTGYRNVDLYVVNCKKDYVNGYYKGLYRSGVPITIDLIEVVE